jgi:ribonuclease E
MPKKLIINAIEEREIRAAILEDGDPVNFFLERSKRKFQKGNIYRARVTSIEPHLQAAFVELERGQHGFLSGSDVIVPDGGISLINGEEEPPIPEAYLKKSKEEAKKRKESFQKKDSKGKEDSKAKDEKKKEEDESSFVEFDDTPDQEIEFGPLPPKTTITESAGDWLLGEEEEITSITEEDWSEEEREAQEALHRPQDVAEKALPLSEPIRVAVPKNDSEESDSSEEDKASLDHQEEGVDKVDSTDSDEAEEKTSEKIEEKEADKVSEDVVAEEASAEPIVQEEPKEGASEEGDAQSTKESESVEEESSTQASEENASPDEDEEESASVDSAIFSIEDELDDEEDDDSDGDSAEGDENGAEADENEGESSETSEEGAVDKSKGSHSKKPEAGKKKSGGRKRRVYMRIEDVLEVGQYVMVQIIKEGIGNKAPMVTTYLSLAGNYMVLTPGGERSGLSKQIRNQKERKRLGKFLDASDVPQRCGLIVRTAAEDIPEKDLEGDMNGLSEVWSGLQTSFKKLNRSALIRKEEGLITRLVREYYTPDFEELWIDDPQAHDEVKDFLEKGKSDLLKGLKLYEGERPIFYHFRLEQALEGLFRRRVNLPGGGSLIFDQGEAMLVIDVNSGTFKEGEDDEDTAFKLNLLACQEVARQVQMRDVGGIIMIDFVDMRRISNRNKVERELKKCFKGDKAKLNILSIGTLGVMQMSRQRTKDSLLNSLYSTCSRCEGTGLTPSKIHSAMNILREIRGNIKRFKGAVMRISTTADMAVEMLNQYKSELVSLEREGELTITVEIDGSLESGSFSLNSKGSKSSSTPKKANFDHDDGARKKKKKPRKKLEDPKQDGGAGMTARLKKLEKDFPGQEPLGVIPAQAKKDNSSEEKNVSVEEKETPEAPPSSENGEKKSSEQAEVSEKKSSKPKSGWGWGRKKATEEKSEEASPEDGEATPST